MEEHRQPNALKCAISSPAGSAASAPRAAARSFFAGSPGRDAHYVQAIMFSLSPVRHDGCAFIGLDP